jgi:transposase-like protein
MKIKTKCEYCNRKKECNVYEYNGRFTSKCDQCNMKDFLLNTYYKGSVKNYKKIINI